MSLEKKIQTELQTVNAIAYVFCLPFYDPALYTYNVHIVYYTNVGL